MQPQLKKKVSEMDTEMLGQRMPLQAVRRHGGCQGGGRCPHVIHAAASFQAWCVASTVQHKAALSHCQLQ
jgi:hypothetical protein